MSHDYSAYDKVVKYVYQRLWWRQELLSVCMYKYIKKKESTKKVFYNWENMIEIFVRISTSVERI